MGLWLWIRSGTRKQQQSESLYTNALKHLVRGEKSTAVRLLRETVKQNSDHVEAYLQLGNILRDSHPQQAIKIHQSLTVRPKLDKSVRIDIHKALSQDYQSVGELKLAKREAERMLSLEKRNIWATECLLSIAEKEGDWPEAIQQAKLVQRLRNKQNSRQLARYQVLQGEEALKNGDVDGARSAFIKATKIAPHYGMPHYHLGNIFEEERNLVKAVEHWESFALQCPEDSSKVYTKIEAALFDLGQFSEVENFYRKLLEEDPGNLDALAKLANVLEEKGERDAALNLVEDALRKHEKNLHVRLMKLKLSLQTNTPHDLANQIDGIIKDLPENGSPKPESSN